MLRVERDDSNEDSDIKYEQLFVPSLKSITTFVSEVLGVIGVRGSEEESPFLKITHLDLSFTGAWEAGFLGNLHEYRIDPTRLPNLTSISGPPDAITAFASGRNIETVHVRGSSGRFLTQMATMLHSLNNVQRLRLAFVPSVLPAIEIIVGRFPGLLALEITSFHAGDATKEFLYHMSGLTRLQKLCLLPGWDWRVDPSQGPVILPRSNAYPSARLEMELKVLKVICEAACAALDEAQISPGCRWVRSGQGWSPIVHLGQNAEGKDIKPYLTLRRLRMLLVDNGDGM